MLHRLLQITVNISGPFLGYLVALCSVVKFDQNFLLNIVFIFSVASLYVNIVLARSDFVLLSTGSLPINFLRSRKYFIFNVIFLCVAATVTNYSGFVVKDFLAIVICSIALGIQLIIRAHALNMLNHILLLGSRVSLYGPILIYLLWNQDPSVQAAHILASASIFSILTNISMLLVVVNRGSKIDISDSLDADWKLVSSSLVNGGAATLIPIFLPVFYGAEQTAGVIALWRIVIAPFLVLAESVSSVLVAATRGLDNLYKIKCATIIQIIILLVGFLLLIFLTLVPALNNTIESLTQNFFSLENSISISLLILWNMYEFFVASTVATFTAAGRSAAVLRASILVLFFKISIYYLGSFNHYSDNNLFQLSLLCSAVMAISFLLVAFRRNDQLFCATTLLLTISFFWIGLNETLM